MGDGTHMLWILAMALMVMLVIGGGTYLAYLTGERQRAHEPARRPGDTGEDRDHHLDRHGDRQRDRLAA